MRLALWFRSVLTVLLAAAALQVQARVDEKPRLENLAFSQLECDCEKVLQVLVVQQENVICWYEFVSATTHYNYYRNYLASQGRYTQNDPIGLAGGWNRFGYVDGNPLSYSDPLGLWSVEVTLNVGIGGSLAFGRDPSTDRGFLNGKFGVGLGTGFQYDPLGGRPGGGDGDKSKWGGGVGFYGEAGGALGSVSGKLEGSIGRNFNYGQGSELYRNFGPKGSLGKDGKFGVKAGASCGVEWSIF